MKVQMVQVPSKYERTLDHCLVPHVSGMNLLRTEQSETGIFDTHPQRADLNNI